MFGYVTIRKDDLKVKDYNKYQAYYCGLCQDIKEAYGKKGQAMLTFDMTFLSILLTGLYECETKEEEHYCFLHPGKKHKCLRNKYTKYCADMNVLLAEDNELNAEIAQTLLESEGVVVTRAVNGFEKICDTHRGIVSAPDESSAGLPRKAACMREGKQSRPRSCGGLYRRGDGGDLYSGGGHLER